MRENLKVGDSCSDFMKGPQQVTEGEAVTRCAAVPRNPAPLIVVLTLYAFLLSNHYIHVESMTMCAHKWQHRTFIVRFGNLWGGWEKISKWKFSFTRNFGWLSAPNLKGLLVWSLLWILPCGEKESWRHGLDEKMLPAFTEGPGLILSNKTVDTSGFSGHMYILTYRYKHICN